MKIIGLTGSMATGKSTLVQQIRQNLHWPIWDADVEVQNLYETPFVIEQIINSFPETKIQTARRKQVNRSTLRRILNKDPSQFDTLEFILHPLLDINRKKFLRTMQFYRQPFVVLDIPLLFEKNLQTLCDVTVLTHCPEWLQKRRILKRPDMTTELMNHLLARQIPFHQKKHLVDIVIETGLNKGHSWNVFTQKIQQWRDQHEFNNNFS